LVGKRWERKTECGASSAIDLELLKIYPKGPGDTFGKSPPNMHAATTFDIRDMSAGNWLRVLGEPLLRLAPPRPPIANGISIYLHLLFESRSFSHVPIVAAKRTH